MPEVILAIASNQDREKHIHFALTELETCYGTLAVSPTYESRAQAPSVTAFDYHNLVVSFHTTQTHNTLKSHCKTIEQHAGRTNTSITLDIDILLYGDDIVHPDILNCAYVLRPLAELLPEQLHPNERKSYALLWQQMQATQSKQSLQLTPINSALIKTKT